MPDERQLLTCVGGPAAGRQEVVDPAVRYHSIQVSLKSDVTDSIINYKGDPMQIAKMGETHRYRVMQIIASGQNIFILVYEPLSDHDALIDLLRFYREHH